VAASGTKPVISDYILFHVIFYLYFNNLFTKMTSIYLLLYVQLLLHRDPCAIKTFHFIFSITPVFLRGFFYIFVPKETGKNITLYSAIT